MCANCSEVVRRLVNEAIKHQGDATWLDPTVAETILHSWRERRVQELEDAKAEVAACIEYLHSEVGWEWFRAEQLYFKEEAKQRACENNARLLTNYLAEKGHGLKFLQEHRTLKQRVAELEQLVGDGLRGAEPDATGKPDSENTKRKALNRSGESRL